VVWQPGKEAFVQLIERLLLPGLEVISGHRTAWRWWPGLAPAR
jgi:hypothetical protein